MRSLLSEILKHTKRVWYISVPIHLKTEHIYSDIDTWYQPKTSQSGKMWRKSFHFHSLSKHLVSVEVTQKALLMLFKFSVNGSWKVDSLLSFHTNQCQFSNEPRAIHRKFDQYYQSILRHFRRCQMYWQ